mgnify:CR=1 FL=1
MTFSLFTSNFSLLTLILMTFSLFTSNFSLNTDYKEQ